MKICHFTTVHPREDVRIFYKECSSLAENGYNITLIVADGKGNETKNKVEIIDIGDYRMSRLKRLLFGRKIMLKKALSLNSDIYHFHDPELLPTALKLKRKNKKVIYDCHEDVAKQILYKTWLGPLPFRKFLAKTYDKYEKRICKQLDGLVSVIDEITNKFQVANRITLKNYPIIKEIASKQKPINERQKKIVYIGSLSKVRGIKDYVEAMADVNTNYELILIGKFSSEEFHDECKELKSWGRVNYMGFLPLDKAIDVYSKCYIGLSVLHPEKNYLTSLPTKGFEYMASGIPTIMSNFDYWIPYFENCAVFISPQNPKQLAQTINHLISSKEQYQKLVENCNELVHQYSWENEFDKLVDLYNSILN